jgi:hypothetical protein
MWDERLSEEALRMRDDFAAGTDWPGKERRAFLETDLRLLA